MSLGWDTYLYQLENGRPAAVTLDLDVTIEDVEGLPQLIQARLHLNSPSEHGLINEDEATPLAEAEEAFEYFVDDVSGGAGLFVASLTVNGQCILHAYVPEGTELPETLTLGAYTADVRTQEDEEWSVFFEGLFPAEDQLQWIVNRRVTSEMEEAGEDLSVLRQTVHSAFFPNQNAARAFADGAAEDGFVVVSVETDADGSSVVTLACKQSVDLPTINETTQSLVAMAATCGGIYDGWEAEMLVAAPFDPDNWDDEDEDDDGDDEGHAHGEGCSCDHDKHDGKFKN